jgi:hypothetical protein
MEQNKQGATTTIKENSANEQFTQEFAKLLVESAQKSVSRSLWVYSFIVLLFFATITLLWNLYISWIRNLITALKGETSYTITQERLIEAWTKSTYYNFPLINVPIHISDAAMLISFAFFIMVMWLFFSARRENHIIGRSLRLALSADNGIKKYIYYGISFSNLFSTITSKDDPINDLDYKETTSSVKYVRNIVSFVFMAPTVCILLVIIFDILSLFWIESLFRKVDGKPLDSFLSKADFIKVVIMEFMAFGFAVACGFLSYWSYQFEKATNKILQDFTKRIQWDN